MPTLILDSTKFSPKGITAQANKARVIVIIGARIKIILLELEGIIISLKTYFKAKLSGLVDRCTRFFVCINGTESVQNNLFEIDSKVKTIVVSEEKYPNESITINTIKRFCDDLEDRANILYIHNLFLFLCLELGRNQNVLGLRSQFFFYLDLF